MRFRLTMCRSSPPILALLLALGVAPALAEECDNLVEKVAAAARAEIGSRTRDFANFRVSPEITLTLACGGAYPSSVGAQFRGEEPPDAYFTAFGEAGRAVTGIDPGILSDAARSARADATRLRHSAVSAGGARVTCSVTRPTSGPMTLCATIERGEKT